MDRPGAEYADGSVCVQGTVRLRVEFLASGEIGKISPVSFLPYGLTENAIEAAKRIRFEPEIKNGKPITKFKVIEYSFNIYENDSEDFSQKDEKAEAVIKRAIEKLGGEKYLNVKSQIGRGKFSLLRDGALISFQTFVDVIDFPDKERTEFKQGGSKTVQTNFGANGWVFDGDAQTIKDQSEEQINNFKRGIRTSLDSLLRGNWRKEGAKLEYVGRRPASLGKRNDVVKLTFDDGFKVEFEFSDDGLPMKSIYKRLNADSEEVTEEDRYAQFIDVNGIKTPFIIDHFSNKMQTSRINYQSVEFNKSIPDSIFAKPSSAKDLKKDLKL
ncbi:MAG: energy transducer TonB [Pyrinomonadaceae bacterium]